MKSRQVLLGILILGAVWHNAAAQPKKSNLAANAPSVENVLAGTGIPSGPAIADLMTLKTDPEMPLGPKDILKSYEVAMSLVADKTTADIGVIVQAHQSNQITREQAEYLLQQRYQTAMMQYQVLSALHDVLKHDIDEAVQQTNGLLKTTRSDTVEKTPFSGLASASR